MTSLEELKKKKILEISKLTLEIAKLEVEALYVNSVNFK